MTFLFCARVCGAALLLAGTAHAQSVPDTISPPKALNLGSTSFFDGYGRTDEGFSLLEYGRYEDLNRITDVNGHDSPYFKGTSIQVFSELTQVVYTSGWHPFGGDAVGISAQVPLIKLSSSFAGDSPVKLNSNTFGIGDLVWGPSYQSRVYQRAGRPVLSFRLALMIMSPTGSFNRQDSINQSAGYWAINPYVAITYLPTQRLELTTRLNYQYNVRSGNFPNPPSIPGLIYRSGQAGQIIYGNIDTSYEVTDKIRLGLNGYFLQSLNADRTNEQAVRGSEVTEFSIGPGARYTFDAHNAVNVNLYFPVVSCNGSPGPQLNFQLIHRF
jgi:hypothetical protein